MIKFCHRYKLAAKHDDDANTAGRALMVWLIVWLNDFGVSGA